MLCVIGDLVEDVIVRPVAAPPRPDTDNPASIERRRGGSAANVAAAAAAIGARVRFIGRVGDDACGDAVTAELAGGGVDVRVQRGGRTGTIVVVVEPGGVRTMFPDRGAAAELGPIDPGWAEGVTWLHVPAYTWCTPGMGEVTRAFCTSAQESGARLSIDVSSVATITAFGPARFTDQLQRLRPDVVLATRAEAALLTSPVPGLLVVKDGPRAVTLRSPGGGTEEVPVVPVAEVVDPTGAGDAFAAAFVVATMTGAAPSDAARAGSTLASRVLARVGASVR